MAAEVASAFVSLVPSARGFGRATESQVGGEMKTSGSRIGKTFGTALKLGSVAVLGGAALAVGFLKGSLDEAREAQKVGALTVSTIKATGGAANVTARQVGNLSQAISLKTGIDDETIQSGANMLLTFKNIRNEAGKGNDIFNQSTRVLTDLSAAMGTEPRQAAIQLGKALNDPIKGVTALTRVGVTFNAKQKATINALVAGGKTMQAQKIILKELNSEFGGAAAAQATAGDKFKVAFGNLEESVGTALLPIIDKVLGGLTTLAIFLTNNISPTIAALNGWLAPLITNAERFVGAFAGSGQASTFVASLRASFQSLLPTLTSLGQQIGKTVVAIGGFVQALLPTILGVGRAIAAAIGPAIGQIAAVVGGQLLPAFRSLLPVLVPVAKFLLQMFGGAIVGLIKGFAQAVTGAINIVAGIIHLVVALIHGDWAAAWGALKQIAVGALNLVVGAIKVWWNAGILGIFKHGVVALLGSWRGLWTGIKGLASKGAGALRGLVSGLISGIARLFVSGVRSYVNVWRGLFRVLVSLARSGLSAIRGGFTSALNAIRNVVTSAMGRVRSAFVSAMNAVKSAVSDGINAAKEAFSSGVGRIIDEAKSIGGKIVSAVTGLQSRMYSAGYALISGLVSGIGARIGAAVQKVQDGLSKIRGLLPGSPIKWGPLKGWNNTGPSGPGGRLVGLLADGLSNTSPVDAAMTRLTSKIAVASPKIAPGVASANVGVGARGGVTFTGPLYTHDPQQLAREIERRERVAASLAMVP